MVKIVTFDVTEAQSLTPKQATVPRKICLLTGRNHEWDHATMLEKEEGVRCVHQTCKYSGYAEEKSEKSHLCFTNHLLHYSDMQPSAHARVHKVRSRHQLHDCPPCMCVCVCLSILAVKFFFSTLCQRWLEINIFSIFFNLVNGGDSAVFSLGLVVCQGGDAYWLTSTIYSENAAFPLHGTCPTWVRCASKQYRVVPEQLGVTALSWRE